MTISSRLLPCRPDANQRAGGTRQTNDALIEVGIAQCRGWGGQIAEIGHELDAGCHALTLKLLVFNDALSIALVDGRRALCQTVECVQTCNHVTGQAKDPAAVCTLLNLFAVRDWPDARRVELRNRLAGFQVSVNC